MPGMKSTTTSVLALCLFLGSVPVLADQPPDIDELFRILGYTDTDKQAVLNGEIVSVDNKRLRDDQLVAAVAVPLETSLADVAAQLKQGRNIALNTATLSWGEIKTGDPADFADLTYEADEQGEIEALLEIEADDRFNFSSEEIAFLQEKLKDLSEGEPSSAEAAISAYREVLAGRAKAYMSNGLNGIANYDHGGDPLTPADQLRVEEAEAQDFLSTHFPGFWKALSSFPNEQSPQVTSSIFWVKRRVQDRPCFILLHQLVSAGEGFVMVSQRQFYVGHNYESLQMFALALPREQGSMLFSVNSVFTNQVAGFFSGVAGSVGQERTRESMIKHFTNVRQKID